MINEGEYREALSLGKSIEHKNSNDSDFLFIMGSIYYILEDAKNSLYYFDKVLELHPKDVETLFLKANVHLYLQEKEAVIDCCTKILEVDPHHEGANEIMDKLASGN